MLEIINEVESQDVEYEVLFLGAYLGTYGSHFEVDEALKGLNLTRDTEGVEVDRIILAIYYG
jgi:hypothetical protein